MKGISPVIATVLLLLMAVASVGGAWVWYQRQSTLVGGQTEEKIGEQVQQQTGVAIGLAGLYKSGNQIGLIINNGATSTVNVTGYKITTGGVTYLNTTIDSGTGGREISSKTTDTILTLVTTTNCSSATDAKVQIFAAGTSTQVFDDTCP